MSDVTRMTSEFKTMVQDIRMGMPWRCDISGNPYGTDTLSVGVDCQCQGCRAHRRVTHLQQENERLRSTVSNLLKVIEPFMDFADNIPGGDTGDDTEVWWDAFEDLVDNPITYGDLRSLSEAYRKAKKE